VQVPQEVKAGVREGMGMVMALTSPLQKDIAVLNLFLLRR
jgi:hypothetical protein